MQTLMFLAMMLAGMTMPAEPVSAPPPGYWSSPEAAMQAAASTTPYQLVDGVDVPSKPLNTPKVRGVPAPQPQPGATPKQQQQEQQPIVVNVYIQMPAGQAAPGRGSYEDAYYNPVMPSGSNYAPDYAQSYPAASDYGYSSPYNEPGRRYRVGWRSYVPYYGGPFADNYTRFYSSYWNNWFGWGPWNGGWGNGCWGNNCWGNNHGGGWNRGHGGGWGGGGNHVWGGGSSIRGGGRSGFGGDRAGIRGGGGGFNGGRGGPAGGGGARSMGRR